MPLKNISKSSRLTGDFGDDSKAFFLGTSDTINISGDVISFTNQKYVKFRL